MKDPVADDGARRRPSLALLAGAVLLGVGAVFANSLGGEFVWDDRSLIEGNPALESWSRAPGFFVSSFEESSGPGAEISTYYRPLVLISYLVDRTLWGLDPFGFHLTNVVLHAICCVLLLVLLCRLFPPTAGFLGAVLFAVHPIHTESVSWISGRTDLLASTFLLASLLLYLNVRDRENLSARLGGSLVLFVLALFSKEIAVALPLFLLGIEWLFPRPGAALRVFPFLAALALFLVFYLGVVGMSPLALQQVEGFEAPGPGGRLATAGKLLVLYAAKLLFPLRLNAEWEPGWEESVASVWLVVWLALGALAVVALRTRRKEPVLLAALLGWLLFLVPVLNLVPIKEIAAERFLYLPSAALAVFAARGLARFGSLTGGPGVRVTALFLVGLVLLGARTVSRNREWRDGMTLFEVTAAETRDEPRARFNLARELQRQGYLELDQGRVERGRDLLGKAIRRYREVLALGHHSVTVYLALGEIHLARDEIREALDVYQEGVEVLPGVIDLSYALAELHFGLGQDEEARRWVETILEEDPGFAEARRLLGILSYRAGDLPRAEAALERAAVALPNRADIFQVLGTIYARQRRVGEAVQAFQTALELDPVNPTSMENLAKIFVHSPPGTPFHRPKDALVLIERALRYEPRPEFVPTLIKALAADGQEERALEVIDEFLEADLPGREELVRIRESIEERRGR